MESYRSLQNIPGKNLVPFLSKRQITVYHLASLSHPPDRQSEYSRLGALEPDLHNQDRPDGPAPTHDGQGEQGPATAARGQ